MCTFAWIDNESKELKSMVFLKLMFSEIAGKTELKKPQSEASKYE